MSLCSIDQTDLWDSFSCRERFVKTVLEAHYAEHRLREKIMLHVCIAKWELKTMLVGCGGFDLV
jgi:hypothetical protein